MSTLKRSANSHAGGNANKRARSVAAKQRVVALLDQLLAKLISREISPHGEYVLMALIAHNQGNPKSLQKAVRKLGRQEGNQGTSYWLAGLMQKAQFGVEEEKDPVSIWKIGCREHECHRCLTQIAMHHIEEGNNEDGANVLRNVCDSTDYAQAQLELGKMFANAPNRHENAILLLTRASEQGLQQATHHLACCWADKGLYDNALPLFLESARSGIPESKLRLGSMYMTGSGVECDLSVASRWFREALSLGCRDALIHLKTIKQSNPDAVVPYGAWKPLKRVHAWVPDDVHRAIVSVLIANKRRATLFTCLPRRAIFCLCGWLVTLPSFDTAAMQHSIQANFQALKRGESIVDVEEDQLDDEDLDALMEASSSGDMDDDDDDDDDEDEDDDDDDDFDPSS